MERPWTLLLGDSREALRGFADSWVDSIVTDPPYELGFMGRAWDASGVAYDVDLWREALRVLKPGGHLLAFGGTRTYHRMACAIEDAGFEVRDSLHWIYGSGFPKSLDVSKAIDKRGGVMPWQADFARHLRAVKPADVTTAQINAHVANGTKSNFWGHFIDTTSQPLLPTVEQYRRLREIVPIDPVWDELFLPEAEREVVGETTSTTLEFAPGEGRDRPQVVVPITAPATDAARQWAGWGTALKPAHEPVVVARKPLDGTVAANVLAHGTGAINVDGCRVGQVTWKRPGSPAVATSAYGDFVGGEARAHDGGRWPPNILLSHMPDCGDECAEGCAVAEINGQSGTLKSGNRKAGKYETQGYRGAKANPMPAIVGDTGGASRFFPAFRYQAKASRADRGEGNTHPTVKPIELMRWLVRLVTPPGGVVLDPFTGSGTTGIAARREGATFVGVEREPEYHRIALARIAAG